LAFDNGSAGDWLPLEPLSADFNNRDDSKVLEIDPLDGSVDWTYEASLAGLRDDTFFSHRDGGAQRLSNGNTLITETQGGRIFEVTNSLETVWEYVIPYFDANNNNGAYRAYKMPLDWAGPHFVPDLFVSGDDDPDPVQAGDDLTSTIRLENVGSNPAVNVELAEATPVGTTFQSISAPAGWSCSTPAVDGIGPITCTASSLSAGSVAVFTIIFKVDPCGGGGTTITNTATASSLGSDANPGDNSTTIETAVTCP
jgi:uncharacterized repeat protein (TIGR01451 family)